MKKINYKIILGILLLVALVGAVLLVQQKQETRRGATSTTGFIRLSLDGNSTTKEVTAGQEFTVPLVANVDGAGGVDSIVTYFCYDPTKIELKNTSDLEKSFTPIDPAEYVGGSVKVEESSNKCVKVTFVSIKQGKRMEAKVVDINFKTKASSGTGTITIDKSKSSLGVAGQDKVDISSVGNLNYSISGETGGYWIYKGSSPCQKSSVNYATLADCNAEGDPKNSCYASKEECNAVTNPDVYCVGTCPAGTAHKTDGVCSNGGTRDDSSCTDVLTSYCGKHWDYSCCTCKTTTACTSGATQCYNSTNYQTCSDGVWGTATSCGTGKYCSSGQCLSSSSVNTPIIIKMAFTGVKKGSVKCANNWLTFMKIKDVSGNNPLTVGATVASVPVPTDSVNSKGDVIYTYTTNLIEFNKDIVTNGLSFFLVGPKHISIKYGKNGQSSWFSDFAGSLSITGGTTNNYDFSEYPLIAGDVTGDTAGEPDGKIDGRDFSFLKEKANDLLSAAADGTNVVGDIDGNCQANAGDVRLFKELLKEVNGQTY